MSILILRDLAQRRELKHRAMAAVRGGINTGFESKGPLATVDINVSQRIEQSQFTAVNILNNVGSIGANFGPLSLTVSPELRALNFVPIPALA